MIVYLVAGAGFRRGLGWDWMVLFNHRRIWVGGREEGLEISAYCSQVPAVGTLCPSQGMCLEPMIPWRRSVS